MNVKVSIPLWSDFNKLLLIYNAEITHSFPSHYGLILTLTKEEFETLNGLFQFPSHYGLILTKKNLKKLKEKISFHPTMV